MIPKVNLQVPIFYAGISQDGENVSAASSGGIFFELCKYIVSRKGKIYGAVQIDAITVEHRGAETLDEAKAFRRSKYLRSKVNCCYAEIKAELEEGRHILFSGVGCQIAGLYKFLKINYENLYTCEVVCHGVPLSETLKKYCAEKAFITGEKIVELNFRDKRNGWKNNCITEKYDTGREETILSVEHPVHSLYLKGINMEKGCGYCKFQRLPRIADISLADFWKYEGSLLRIGEQEGISLIAVNTEKGDALLKSIKGELYLELSNSELALKSCRHMGKSPYIHPSQKAFERLIEEYDFGILQDLFLSFGEIVLPEDCTIFECPDELRIIETFRNDTQEIVYLENNAHVLVGIVTFGEFIKGYAEQGQWINYNFRKVVLSRNSKKEIKKIFDESKKINRIPVVDKSGQFLFEVRREIGANGKKDKRKELIPFSIMKHRGNQCFFIRRPDLLGDFKYSESQVRRIEKSISFSVMQKDTEKYSSDLIEIYGEKYSEKYIEELCKIPPIIKHGKKYLHTDKSSTYVNVVGGKRITTNMPEEYAQTIHMYGRCGVFGYAVEDGETLPSRLQQCINRHEISVRVINHGLWGADDEKIIHNLTEELINDEIDENSIVIIYMNCIAFMSELNEFGVKILDTTLQFHDFLKGKGNFFDKPGHMTAEGYLFLAEYLYEYINKEGILLRKKENDNSAETKKLNMTLSKEIPKELMSYIEKIKAEIAYKELNNKKVGAIVMNCNPFTKGHRYLIETARELVDMLLIFVLEEDKSFFTFEDRFEMVKRGTEDLENVYVYPSGQYMISALTFPEYFTKEQEQDIVINPAGDIEIFARYIAPAFNISVRFVGSEPIDKITYQYNQSLKQLLPHYGIEIYEIERLKSDHGYVTATEVRRLLQEDKKSDLQGLLPESTLTYLYKNT